MEFGVESEDELPRVAIHVESDYYVMGASQAEGGFNLRFDWSPETTRYGYIVDESVPFEGENEIVPQLVNALPKVASYLMDGFCNWNFGDQINFQDELFNDLLISEEYAEDIYKVGFSVPGAAYSILAWKSVLSYALLDQLVNDPSRMKLPDAQMFYRAGLYFTIIKEDNLNETPFEARKKISEILRYFSSYQFDRQDANALSNLSMLQSAWGDYKAALDSAEKGIALFKAELSQKYVTEMSGGGPFYPIIIKWELYLTKARTLVLLEEHEKAKEPLTTMIREARAMQFDGEELHVAEKLLATL
jgi:tetratricopeptide (TPR) repeat protein